MHTRPASSIFISSVFPFSLALQYRCLWEEELLLVTEEQGVPELSIVTRGYGALGAIEKVKENTHF
jgi:hypothetical protein